jgi:hypothetical protein
MSSEQTPDEDPQDGTWADSNDRKTAVRALAEQRQEDHLTEEEHDRRHTLAKQAQTLGELRALFVDLPAPHPLIGQPPAASAPRWYNSGIGLLLITGSVVLLAAVLLSWWVPALFFAALLVVVTVLVIVPRR